MRMFNLVRSMGLDFSEYNQFETNQMKQRNEIAINEIEGIIEKQLPLTSYLDKMV